MFKACSGSHGPIVKSPYSKNKVPVELFREKPDDPKSKKFKTCLHCRSYTSNKAKNRRERKIKEQEERNKLIEQGLIFTGVCKSDKHNSCSKHPYNEVPLELLKNKKGIITKSCADCRKFDSDEKNAIRNKLKEEKNNYIDETNTFGYCNTLLHNTNSQYPRHLVPRKNFMKFPENPLSELYERCLDCRIDGRNRTNNYIEKAKERAKSDGEEICSSCFRKPPFKNYKSCIDCLEKSKEKGKNLTKIYNSIKLEKIIESGASCISCGIIIFNGYPDDSKIASLQTYFKSDNQRYVLYEKQEYNASEFIKSYSNHLNLYLIDLDHMTESEQREKGILSSKDIFIPKEKDVSSMRSKSSMELEARKTQNLCVLCHRMKTIERRGERKQSLSSQQLEKVNYVNNIKLAGCSNCKRVYPSCLEFLEMDHLDPSTKIKAIATMVRWGKYSFKDVIEECNKCRVICSFCHRIHTAKQRDAGLFIQNNESSDEETDSF